MVHCLENMFKFEELPCFYYLYSALSLFYVTSDTMILLYMILFQVGTSAIIIALGVQLVIEHAELHNIQK